MTPSARAGGPARQTSPIQGAGPDSGLLVCGQLATSMALELFDSLDARRKARVFCDLAPAQKRAALQKAISCQAHVCAVVLRAGRPLAFGWLAAHAPGARSCNAHFMARSGDTAAAARALLALILNNPAYNVDCIYGILPRPFRDARRYLQAAGFRHLAALPGICPIYGRPGLATGDFFILP